jgi:hypothetical protein
MVVWFDWFESNHPFRLLSGKNCAGGALRKAELK